MLSRLTPRVLGLAIGVAASAAGLVIALLGVGLEADYSGSQS